jgi:hypothetical protein
LLLCSLSRFSHFSKILNISSNRVKPTIANQESDIAPFDRHASADALQHCMCIRCSSSRAICFSCSCSRASTAHWSLSQAIFRSRFWTSINDLSTSMRILYINSGHLLLGSCVSNDKLSIGTSHMCIRSPTTRTSLIAVDFSASVKLLKTRCSGPRISMINCFDTSANAAGTSYLTLGRCCINQSINQSINPIQSNPIQSNPIQSNPIQSNPIQSNPIQSNPIHYWNVPLLFASIRLT